MKGSLFSHNYTSQKGNFERDFRLPNLVHEFMFRLVGSNKFPGNLVSKETIVGSVPQWIVIIIIVAYMDPYYVIYKLIGKMLIQLHNIPAIINNKLLHRDFGTFSMPRK